DLLPYERGKPADAGQQVVEVVRCTASQSAHGFEPLRVLQLFLYATLLRDVGERDRTRARAVDRVFDTEAYQDPDFAFVVGDVQSRFHHRYGLCPVGTPPERARPLPVRLPECIPPEVAD